MKKFFLFLFLISSIIIADWNEGVQLFKGKKYKEAIPHFQQVVEAIPNGFSGWYMLGLCYLYLNDFEKASEALKKATQLKPEEGDAAYKYLTVLMKQKKYSEAYTFVKNYREGNIPTEVRGDYYKLSGLASLKEKDFSLAADFLQKAEALVDGDEVPYYLGISAIQTQNYDLAIQSFQKAITRNPKNIDAITYKIKATIEKGRASDNQNEKIKYYNMALQDSSKLLKEKENFENYLLAGEAALGAQKYEDALNFLEKAKTFNKNDGYVYLYIGQAQSSLEKNQEAINSLSQAAILLPEDKKRIAYNQIGFIYEKIKDFDKAIEFYKKTNNEKKIKEVEEKKKIEAENKKADEALKEYEKKKAEQEKKK
jgi:tetratricopeptide (TPR) repeat protein